MGSSYTVPERVGTNAFPTGPAIFTKTVRLAARIVGISARCTAILASFWLGHSSLSVPAQAASQEIAAPDVPEGLRVPLSEPIQRRTRDRQKGQRKNLPADGEAMDRRNQTKAGPLAKDADLPKAKYSGRMMMGWHYPHMITQGNERDRYQAEPGILFDVLFANDSDNQGLQPWYGFGLISTQGSGLYKKEPGRFGYIYLGPRIGFGQILGAAARGNDPESHKVAGSARPSDQPMSVMPWSFAHFFLVGINARITTSEGDSSISVQSSEDFKPGVSWEKPGVSAQYQIHWFHADGWSLGPGLGAVLGSRKTMIWVDFSTSLFL